MLSSNERFNFQEFVERRLGLGRAHFLTLLALGLVEVNDGMQAITISLLTPILKQQLALAEGQVSLLTSIFYVGVGLGALLSGIQSSKSGRRKALLFGSITQFISAVLLAFRFSFSWLCGCRLLYGIGFGSTLAVAAVIATQMMPMSVRGKCLLVISFINSFGKLGGVGLAFIFIGDEQKQIAWYMIASAVFSLLAVVLVHLYIKESYRFLLFRQRNEEAFMVMEAIMAENGEQGSLGEQQKRQIIEWSSATFQGTASISNSFQLLSSCVRLTFLLSASWFLINFIFFGEMFIIPFMLGDNSKGLMQYFWMTLGEVPTIFITFNLIDRKGWGRKTSLLSFFLITGLLCFITIGRVNALTLFLTKMFMKAIFQMIGPFTSQSYPTSARAIGYAVNSFFGRMGSTLMPFIIFPLYNHHPNSPFLLLGLLSCTGALATMAVRHDTLLRPLDECEAASPTSGKQFQVQVQYLQ